MTWFRMDDTWGTHPKVQACSPLARLLWVYGGLYCAQHLTDGAIPKTIIPLLLASSGASRKHPGELVAAGLWAEHPDTFEVLSWHEYQPSRDDVQAVKLKRRAAGVEANHQRWHIAKGITSPTCPLCDPKSDRSTDSDRIPPVLIPSSSDSTNGCTDNSSSAEWTPADDDLAQQLGHQDHLDAVAAGVRMIDADAHRAECIRRRAAELAQPLLPADAPLPVDEHAGCGPECDHGWLHPNGPDGGAARCPGTPA